MEKTNIATMLTVTFDDITGDIDTTWSDAFSKLSIEDQTELYYHLRDQMVLLIGHTTTSAALS